MAKKSGDLENSSSDIKIIREAAGETAVLNFEKQNIFPSIEKDPNAFVKVFDLLLQNPSLTRIILSQKQKIIYDYKDIEKLLEIVSIFRHSSKAIRDLEASNLLDPNHSKSLNYLIHFLMKSDPVGCFVDLKRLRREVDPKADDQYSQFLKKTHDLLSKTKLVESIKPYLAGHTIGEREIYEQVFSPISVPAFMSTSISEKFTSGEKELDFYTVKNMEITILRKPNETQPIYHISPPEFALSEDKYNLIELARTVLTEHRPSEKEFVNPSKMRRTFFNIGRDLLLELSQSKGVNLTLEEVDELAHILVRYTVGFGIIESILQDEKIQDITINSPIGETPIFVVHADFGECITNIFPSSFDADLWATRFRLTSGRPLDEANPVLDTEIEIPGARARVSAITNPLNPYGLAFAFRRHRDKPWTLPLFINNKMLSPLAAGFLSFVIEGGRTILFAGTRSSGKTSLLGSSLSEMMRKTRIITLEDSVTGDSELLIRNSNKVFRKNISSFVDHNLNSYGSWYNLSGHEITGNYENSEILAMNKKGKIRWVKPSRLIRHKVNKPIYEILTRTGKKIKVTGDHSLFGLGNNAEISEVKSKNLKKGDFIATSRKIPENLRGLNRINLLDHLDKFDKGYLFGDCVKKFLKKNKFGVHEFGKRHGHNRSLRSLWLRTGLIPIKIVKDLKFVGYDITELKNAKFKYSANSSWMPVIISLDKDLLTFIGLWLADGCYDRSSVILSVVEEENRAILKNLERRFGFNVKMHSDNFSLQANSKIFKDIMVKVLDLKGNAYTKRVPEWIFNLSSLQIAHVLRGIFSGDGCVSDKEIVMSLSSRKLLEDVQILLMNFGITLRIGKLKKDGTHLATISASKFYKIFKKEIGVIPLKKLNNLNKSCSKISSHDTTDIIPLTLSDKFRLKELGVRLNYHDYITRNNNLGKEKLSTTSQSLKMSDPLVENIKDLVKSDIFWDQILSVKKIENFEGFVYDLSVPGCESFVTGGIVAHNTLELPVNSLRDLGFNIQSLKVRSALGSGEGEMPASEGIRTSLRLGDSSLIIGEIRSSEAKALFEAMRIGALANVVAGTIHGSDPYSVFDRVVNDLRVPITSFKAVDIIVVSNPVKSPDGLSSKRRVLQISEIRKDWEKDPLKEKGFVDLFVYNSKTDKLEPTKELLNGNSEIVKGIASRIPDWAGSWDKVWKNIELRAKIKEEFVKFAKKNDLKVLEADYSVKLNEIYHLLIEKSKKQKSRIDNKFILSEFKKWMKSMKS